MRIHFERTGGMAGMRLSMTVDVSSLSAEEAHALKEQLSAAGFFELPAALNETGRVTDQFCYRITVEEDLRRHTVEISELAAPEPLRAVLRRLTRLARTRR